MKGRYQAKQAKPYKHTKPSAFSADDNLHGLWQRVVNVGELGPVAGSACK
jgi:hypothetical protein